MRTDTFIFNVKFSEFSSFHRSSSCLLTCFDCISVCERKLDGIMLHFGGDDVWPEMVINGALLWQTPLAEVCDCTVKDQVVWLWKEIRWLSLILSTIPWVSLMSLEIEQKIVNCPNLMNIWTASFNETLNEMKLKRMSCPYLCSPRHEEDVLGRRTYHSGHVLSGLVDHRPCPCPFLMGRAWVPPGILHWLLHGLDDLRGQRCRGIVVQVHPLNEVGARAGATTASRHSTKRESMEIKQYTKRGIQTFN